MSYRTLTMFLTGVVASCILLLVSGCKKEPLERDVHENLVIRGNEAPPYDGTTSLEVSNYVNKVYIDALGREPLENELNTAVNYLYEHYLTKDAREHVVDGILNTQDYFDRLFEILSGQMIGGIDSLELVQQIQLFEYVKYLDSLSNGPNTLVQEIYDIELGKLYLLQAAKPAYKVGTITLNEVYGRFMNNYFYDQINMGSENFVKACFENLLKRLPTETELSNGIQMIDGNSTEILLQPGDSKGDFTNILTHSGEYYQGLVIDNFNALLVRDPGSYEMGLYAVQLQQTGTLSDFQKEILISEEYAGF